MWVSMTARAWRSSAGAGGWSAAVRGMSILSWILVFCRGPLSNVLMLIPVNAYVGLPISISRLKMMLYS